ncbi:hypothetical protein G6F56_009158 [Rhizopus delemar]|nr:hypothetical protein G6F56_009158 [Rhizopus delemar]
MGAGLFICLLITIIIFISALPLVRQTSFILLQGVPKSVPLSDVNESLLKLDGVLSVHELHVWQLSDTKLIASLHVLLESRRVYMKSASEIRNLLHQFGIHSATIQPEFVNHDDIDEKLDIQSENKSDTPYLKSNSSTCMLKCIEDACLESNCCPPVVHEA